ncbi:MAG TPA: NADH-quinone oxidoreductase subunit L, partial [Rugosimonospora sp.]|nr:NADH-quinone oxidoreductase subunit L [Rugosimonospora sp.]
PSALLGFAGLDGAFARRLGTDSLVSFDALAILPLFCLAAGVALAWRAWRRDPAVDPALSLGRLAPVFAQAFFVDRVQEAVVVRPVQALARAVRRTDESIVDGAVEATGRGTVRLGALVNRAHRRPLPWAAGAALAGAVLIGLAAVLLVGTR